MNKEKYLKKLEQHYSLNTKKIDQYYQLGLEIAKNINKSEDSLLFFARLALSSKSDIMMARQRMAERGIEYTPAEIEESLKIIKIVLECL